MPYIKEERRMALDQGATMEGPGELNYAITLVLQAYMFDKKPSYAVCNDIIGALESAKLEFYRRVVSPYEDDKIEENGDVY